MQPASSGMCPNDEALAVGTGEAGIWGSRGGLPIANVLDGVTLRWPDGLHVFKLQIPSKLFTSEFATC